MYIQKLVLGPLKTNCYIVAQSRNSRHVILIDPADDAHVIQEAIGDRQLLGVFLTHGHYDHTGALKDFAGHPIYMHEDEAAFMADPYTATGGGDPTLYATRPAPTQLVKDGDEITLPGFETPVRVMHTPGHTPGCVVYCLDQDYFTGDTLFANGGYGRFDLPGGNMRQLMNSLRKLLRSPVDASIHPGHGDSSTLFHERG